MVDTTQLLLSFDCVSWVCKVQSPLHKLQVCSGANTTYKSTLVNMLRILHQRLAHATRAPCFAWIVAGRGHAENLASKRTDIIRMHAHATVSDHPRSSRKMETVCKFAILARTRQVMRPGFCAKIAGPVTPEITLLPCYLATSQVSCRSHGKARG